MTDHELASIEAWSTLAAAVFAATAAVFAYRAYVKESRIEKRLRDNDERAQASKVAAWIDVNPTSTRPGAFVIIRNASEVPIYDVRAHVEVANQQIPCDIARVVAPSTEGIVLAIPHRAQELFVGEISRHGLSATEDMPVGLTFIDASGAEWSRNTKGQLNRV